MTPLRDDQFIEIVQQAALIDHQTAERAVQAVLQTLGERLSVGEARDLAEQLPPDIGAWLAPDRRSPRMSVQDFLRCVAVREGIDIGTAACHARAVFVALGRAVDPRDLRDVASELPIEYGPLLSAAPGPHPSLVPAERFYQKVADRAGVRTEQARRITDAVLETLAERVAGGEVEDLLAQLPVELHEPLRRGAKRTRDAVSMPLEEFLRHVAEREGTPRQDEAREHARAVFETLREALTREEFYDLSAQLPSDYARVGPKP
jgi:uncharacterized protein (DUF2267 family)